MGRPVIPRADPATATAFIWGHATTLPLVLSEIIFKQVIILPIEGQKEF